MEIKVILLFGLTELKAVISWEDGVSHQFSDNITSLTPVRFRKRKYGKVTSCHLVFIILMAFTELQQ
jgi:hypothetical protein